MTIAQQIKSTVEIVRAVADAIRAAGSIPSGHLYAHLMAYGMKIQEYEQIIGLLTRSGLVNKKNDLLTWNLPLDSDTPQ